MDEFLRNLGFVRSKLDPCVYFLWGQGDELLGILGLAVDDMIYGGTPYMHELIMKVQRRFPFGKVDEGSGRFCGREWEQMEDCSIKMHQQYYAEKSEPIEISRERRKYKDSDVTELERSSLREKGGALNWLQGISRPDLSGACSLLQTSFGKAKVSDLLEANRLIKEAKSNSELGVIFASTPLSDIRFGATGDSAWANREDCHSQMGYVVFATDQRMEHGSWAPFSPMLWKSHRQKRKAPSTLSAEAMAAGETVGVLDWLRVFFEEVTNKRFVLNQWEEWISKRPAILLTDCKSVYDALNQQWTSGSKCDKRTTIDLAIIRDVLSRDMSRVRWIDTRMQLADSMTKNGVSLSLLRFVMAHSKYIIAEESEALRIK